MASDPVRLPTVIGIGAQKAGTSWLHENLADHPDVFVPPFKELHFFDFKFLEDSKKWGRWHVQSHLRKLAKFGDLPPERRAYLDSLAAEPILNGNWYKRVFSVMGPKQIGVDITPEYCQLPEEGIDFAIKFLKKPKIIYIIRDPVTRALSQIRMNMNRKKMPYTDLAAWEAAAREPVVALRGDYKTFVPRWDRASSDVLYLPFGEIERNPLRLLRRVEDHCGLEKSYYPKASKRIFPTPEVEAPPSIHAYLAEELRSQTDFLRERFGEEFCRQM